MEWLQLIISFVLGGGISVLISARYTSMSAKVDAYGKMETFWQESNEKIRAEFSRQITELEARIKEVEKNECLRLNCKIRIN